MMARSKPIPRLGHSIVPNVYLAAHRQRKKCISRDDKQKEKKTKLFCAAYLWVKIVPTYGKILLFLVKMAGYFVPAFAFYITVLFGPDL